MYTVTICYITHTVYEIEYMKMSVLIEIGLSLIDLWNMKDWSSYFS